VGHEVALGQEPPERIDHGAILAGDVNSPDLRNCATLSGSTSSPGWQIRTDMKPGWAARADRVARLSPFRWIGKLTRSCSAT
jgi:hypothetical protein